MKSKDSSDTIPFFVTSSKENFWGTKPWQTIDTYVHHEEALREYDGKKMSFCNSKQKPIEKKMNKNTNDTSPVQISS